MAWADVRRWDEQKKKNDGASTTKQNRKKEKKHEQKTWTLNYKMRCQSDKINCFPVLHNRGQQRYNTIILLLLTEQDSITEQRVWWAIQIISCINILPPLKYNECLNK